MRISDWSSDVCSSDLPAKAERAAARHDLDNKMARVDFRLLGDFGPAEITPIGDAKLNRVELPANAVRGGEHGLKRAEAEHAPRCPDDVSGPPQYALQSVRNGRADQRSAEHTSELQTLMRLSYAVFCLKKKKSM